MATPDITIYAHRYRRDEENPYETETLTECSDALEYHADNLGEWIEHWGTSVAAEWEAASLVDTVVLLLTGYAHQFYAAETSDSPTDGVGVYYLDHPHTHPYTGVRTERSAHLEGFTAEQQREIYAGVFPQKVAQQPQVG
jgi:hypothetical protein